MSSRVFFAIIGTFALSLLILWIVQIVSVADIEYEEIILDDTVLVTRVIDGDTVEIEGGERVRYIGIDTPETVHPRREVECFGIEASEKNKELVEGRRVRLEKDVSDTDRFGRLLRYVYVDDVFVNEVLVREGYATVSTFPPDVKYEELFLEAEREAREYGRGLWEEGVCDE